MAVGIVVAGHALQANGQSEAVDNQRSPLGVNIREVRYWSSELPTVDFFKRASNGERGLWLTQKAGQWNTKEQANLDLDAAGWPRSLPGGGAGYDHVTTILVGTRSPFPTGRWTVFYDGEGMLSYGGDAVRNAAASAPGRDIFEVAAPKRGITLSIVATDPKRNGNYIRNIRVIPPGGTCNNDPFSYAADPSACPGTFRPLTQTYAAEPFHPLFLRDLRPFSALRFMQFAGIVLDQTSDWAQRTRYSEISWGVAPRGAPIEVALDLANLLNASPWLEVPARADDNYVTQFARLARSRYTGTRPIYLEYHNEVWNGAYPFNINGNWIEQQGVARWGSASGEPGHVKRMSWFGMRTKQICSIWKREFADRPGRVICVMGGWASNPAATEMALACPLHAQEPGGSPCDSAAGIDAVAIAPYLGGHIAHPIYQDQTANWLVQSDGGLGKLFDEITTGGALAPPKPPRAMPSLAALKSWIAANKEVANKHRVALLAYEGGNELLGHNTRDAHQIAMQTLAERANRDPRMGTVYAGLYAAWKASGGDLFMVYESTGDYSAMRGNSTLLEWQGQPPSQAPKYKATLDFIAKNPCWWQGCTLSPARTGSR